MSYLCNSQSPLNNDLNMTCNAGRSLRVAMPRKTHLPKGKQKKESLGLLLPVSRTAHPAPFRFLDLPAEIRNMIYMEAFGGKRIHLCNMIHVLGKIRHYVCPDDVSSHCNCFGAERARDVMEINTPSCQKLTSYISRFKLNATILKTCRQIHYEAISILYDSNTFDVNRKAPWRLVESETPYPEITLSPLFEFTDQVRPRFLNWITRLEMSWFFTVIPTSGNMALENRITRSAKSWSAHWDRIGRKFPNIRELIVRIMFKHLRSWVAGAYMFWALPMLKALGVLRTCKIFVEHSGPWLFSLEDLATVMCSGLSTPEDSAACFQKALADYPTHEKRPLFPKEVLGDIVRGESEGGSWLFPQVGKTEN